MILEILIALVVAGVLIGISVHLFPCAQSGVTAITPGIPTGPPVMALGTCMIGVIASAYHIAGGDMPFVIITSAITSVFAMSLTMIMVNITYLCIGTVIATSRRDPDVVTGFVQKPYIQPEGFGSGLPTQLYVSGLFASLIGGIAGGLVFYVVYNAIPSENVDILLNISGIIVFGFFLTNAVLATYIIQGNSEGFIHTKKMKLMPKTIVCCLLLSLCYAVLFILAFKIL